MILDACRVDLLEAAIDDGWRPPEPFVYETTTSLESATEPWIERTVDVGPDAIDAGGVDAGADGVDAGADGVTPRDDAVEPTTYVCSNPFSVAARDAPVVETLDEVWQCFAASRVGSRLVSPSETHDRRRRRDRGR